MSVKITLIDAGIGNLRSVEKSLQNLGAEVILTSDPAVVRNGGQVVLPGVGAFGKFMEGMVLHGLAEAVREVVSRGDVLLGICVGMQALFEVGLENGEFRGLGLLPGKVKLFNITQQFKVPHTGWDQIWTGPDSALFKEIEPGTHVYFNHSYYCDNADPKDAAAWTEYGGQFTCAVQHENLFGVQFHPEKSQKVGLKILDNFIHLRGG